MLWRPGLGKTTVVDEPTSADPITSPSARKITNPVGVPEGLLTEGVNVTGLNWRAGFGDMVKLTVGAGRSGGLLSTKVLNVPEAFPNEVAVAGSVPPTKFAATDWVPLAGNVVSNDAHPYTLSGTLTEVPPLANVAVPTGMPPSERAWAAKVTDCPMLVFAADTAPANEVDAVTGRAMVVLRTMDGGLVLSTRSGCPSPSISVTAMTVPGSDAAKETGSPKSPCPLPGRKVVPRATSNVPLRSKSTGKAGGFASNE